MPKQIRPRNLILFARLFKLLSSKISATEGVTGVYFDTPNHVLIKFLQRLGCVQVDISPKTMKNQKKRYANSAMKGLAPKNFIGFEVKRFVYRFYKKSYFRPCLRALCFFTLQAVQQPVLFLPSFSLF